MANETIFEKFGRLFFTRNQIKDYEGKIGAAGINLPAESFAGYISINIIVGTFFLTTILLLHKPAVEFWNKLTTSVLSIELPFFISAIIVLVFSLGIVYISVRGLTTTYLLMNADNRRKKLETNLPDFLLLVGSNIKSGMTLDQALWYSAKPEFGVLSSEVKECIKGAFSGETLEVSLDKLASRFDSRTFRRTIMLLKQASTTGGELTSILEKTADDVRNTVIMRKEIAASLTIYEMFVLIASAFGAPFLFAIGGKIVQIFEKIAPQISGAGDLSGASALGGSFTALSALKFSGPAISSQDFFYFAIPMIFVTALISSFIVSIIRSGTKNQGMKYLPFILIVAYSVYTLIGGFLDSVFATLV